MSYMIIYSLPNCCDCKALKKYLTEKGVEFEDKIVSTQKDMEEIGNITGKTQVDFPVVVRGEEIICGLNYDKF